MKEIILGLALASLGLFASNAIAASPVKPSEQQDGSERILKIVTHEGGPVHRRLTLALNKAAVVELDADARDVLVSNPDIVDAVVRAPRRIFLLAMKLGQANAFFFDARGHQLLSVDIRVEKDVNDLAQMIGQDLPGSVVHVAALNDSIVLTGTVGSALEARHAQDLATRFATDPDKPTDPAKVVNMLRVQGGEQVMLKVRIAEMQRQIAKQFGFNAATAGVIGGVPLALASDNQFALLGRALSQISGAQVGQLCSNPTVPAVLPPAIAVIQGAAPCNIANNAQATLKALERVGLLHTLAEPNLTAVSGETAKFLAGGEFPVPASRDRDGNITVVFKDFGVGLSFTPVVMAGGRISLQMSTEVSELSNTGAFTLAGASTTDANGNTITTGGITIPAISVRRAQTTIELPSGGSFAVAGLMQHTSKQTIDAFPGLKDMPVLGALFRSRDFQDDETELVIVVSAYLVNPTAEAKFVAPTDGYIAATDPETILLGRLNAVYPPKDGAAKKALPPGSVGFIVQ